MAQAIAGKGIAPSAGRDLFQEEMLVGQKNLLVYQWAKKGTRPRQPKDQRYANASVGFMPQHPIHRYLPNLERLGKSDRCIASEARLRGTRCQIPRTP
jgi:hypothetical protein